MIITATFTQIAVIFMAICWIAAPFLLAWTVWYNRTTGRRLKSMEKELSDIKYYLTVSKKALTDH